MTVIYTILGIVLIFLIFMNTKNAAGILCRIIGGIGTLIIFNTVSPFFTPLGINLVTGTVVGMLGLPGLIMILFLGIFL